MGNHLFATKAEYSVACVGDSITYGYMLDPKDSYPSQLNQLLGSNWEVSNFGHSGACVNKSLGLPYVVTDEWASVTSDKFDVIIMLLGTNDTQPNTWEASSFEESFLSMLNDL